MNKVRTLVVTTITAGLLAGSVAGVHSQSDEADPMATAAVSGEFFGGCPEGRSSITIDGVTMIRDITFSCQRVEASDSRLSGDNVYVGNWDGYDEDGFQIEAANWTLTNADGSWIGTNTALIIHGAEEGDDDVLSMETVTLTGQGAYEGLTAHLYLDWSQDPVSFHGAIFPGEMVAFPPSD